MTALPNAAPTAPSSTRWSNENDRYTRSAGFTFPAASNTGRLRLDDERQVRDLDPDAGRRLAQPLAQADQFRHVALVHVGVVRDGALGRDHVLGDAAPQPLQLDARAGGAVVGHGLAGLGPV